MITDSKPEEEDKCSIPKWAMVHNKLLFNPCTRAHYHLIWTQTTLINELMLTFAIVWHDKNGRHVGTLRFMFHFGYCKYYNWMCDLYNY